MTTPIDDLRARIRASVTPYRDLLHQKDVAENRVLGAKATTVAALDRTRGRADARELQDCLLDILAELERTPT